MKSVLITGCSSGLGYYLAEEFLKRKWKVYGISRTINKKLEKSGAILFKVDINSHIDIESVLLKIEKIDILINNAGYAQFGPLIELDLKYIVEQFNTNFFSQLFITQKAIPLLLKSESPRIVNIGSMSGILPTPFGGAYCSSKSAINMVTEVLRMELVPLGIKVIKILPGVFKSGFGNRSESHIVIKEKSLYKNLEQKLKTRSHISQTFNTKTQKYAFKIVSKIIKKNPPYKYYTGKGAYSSLLLKIVFPLKILDFILIKFSGIGVNID